jgi:hypothetical protein
VLMLATIVWLMYDALHFRPLLHSIHYSIHTALATVTNLLCNASGHFVDVYLSSRSHSAGANEVGYALRPALCAVILLYTSISLLAANGDAPLTNSYINTPNAQKSTDCLCVCLRDIEYMTSYRKNSKLATRYMVDAS